MAHQVTLISGPVLVDVAGYRFTRNRAVSVTDEALALRLKGDSNFQVVSPATAVAPVPAVVKQAKSPPPSAKPVVSSPASTEEGESEEGDDDLDGDGDGDNDEGDEEQAPLTREELKSLKKADLVEIATSNSVEVDPQASKAELIDAIMEVLGEEG